MYSAVIAQKSHVNVVRFEELADDKSLSDSTAYTFKDVMTLRRGGQGFNQLRAIFRDQAILEDQDIPRGFAYYFSGDLPFMSGEQGPRSRSLLDQAIPALVYSEKLPPEALQKLEGSVGLGHEEAVKSEIEERLRQPHVDEALQEPTIDTQEVHELTSDFSFEEHYDTKQIRQLMENCFDVGDLEGISHDSFPLAYKLTGSGSDKRKLVLCQDSIDGLEKGKTGRVTQQITIDRALDVSTENDAGVSEDFGLPSHKSSKRAVEDIDRLRCDVDVLEQRLTREQKTMTMTPPWVL